MHLEAADLGWDAADRDRVSEWPCAGVAERDLVKDARDWRGKSTSSSRVASSMVTYEGPSLESWRMVVSGRDSRVESWPAAEYMDRVGALSVSVLRVLSSARRRAAARAALAAMLTARV